MTSKHFCIFLGLREAYDSTTTMPARKHDASLKDRKKKPKYIDMVQSALCHFKTGDGVSKTKIMEYISDNYGLSKDVKTANSIRTACESCWKKGLLIKTRYGRDNILYKLDDEVPHTSNAETTRLGKTEESTLKQEEKLTSKQKSSVCKSRAPETDTIRKKNPSSKRRSVTKRKEMGKISRLEK